MNSITRRNFIKILSTALISAVPFFQYIPKGIAETKEFITDFGGIIHKYIIGYTDNILHVQNLLKNKKTIHPRGSGHSCMGKSMKNNATIFTIPPSSEFSLNQGIVQASAGDYLIDIDTYLEQHNLMLPVSPDHRSLSLGGVLSVGGFDVTSCHLGGLVDHVESIDILTKSGNIIKNIPPTNPNYKNILCGIGKNGIILSAKIKTIQKSKFTYIEEQELDTVQTYIDAAKDFISSPRKQEETDIFYSGWPTNRSWMTTGKHIYDENIQSLNQSQNFKKIKDYRQHRKERTDRWVFAKPYKYYIWSDHFVPLSHLKEQLTKAINLRDKYARQGVEVTVFSYAVKANQFYSNFPHHSAESHVFSVGLYSNFLPHQKILAISMAQDQMKYSKQSQALRSAKPYRYGWEWEDDFSLEKFNA